MKRDLFECLKPGDTVEIERQYLEKAFLGPPVTSVLHALDKNDLYIVVELSTQGAFVKPVDKQTRFLRATWIYDQYIQFPSVSKRLYCAVKAGDKRRAR